MLDDNMFGYQEFWLAAEAVNISGLSRPSAAGHTYTGWLPERVSPSQMYSDQSSSSASTESGKYDPKPTILYLYTAGAKCW